MNKFTAALQRTKTPGKYRVVIYSPSNMKKVSAGEVINDKRDAREVADNINKAFRNKAEPLDIFPHNYKWTKNSGPKKKTKAPKK